VELVLVLNMPIPIRNTGATRPQKVEIKLDSFKRGVNKLVEATRLKADEAVEATNLMLDQDGVYTVRWGTDYYTPEITGVTGFDGFAEYSSGSTRQLILVADDGKIYKSVDGGTASEVVTAGSASAGLTAGNTAFFKQIGSYLYITNGVDHLVRYDGTNISTYTELNAPGWAATPLARGGGLSSGAFTYYYQVTALNEVGETVGSTEESLAVDKERGSWDPTQGDEYITVDWAAVSGATQYQIYIGTESGYLNKVKTVMASATAWNDTGEDAVNTYIEVPDDNTTGAPQFTHMEISNNRLWSTGDPDFPYRVYFSGTGQYIGTFSDWYGGGWIDLEKGGRERPIAMVHYITGGGNGIATAICSTPEGKGSVWQISIVTATVEDETFSVPSATKIVGSVGSSAPLSVVQAGNDVFFANKRGIFALGTEKNYYGILRTNELTSKIRPYWEGIEPDAIDNVCAYDYQAKVFFSITTSGTTNNRIIYYDRERIAWVVDWSIGVKQFGEYTDSTGTTHLLGSEAGSGKLIEFSEHFKGDKGSAFNTSYISPKIPMGKKWDDFARIKKAYIRLGNPVGSINFEIVGTTKDNSYSGLVSETITSLFSLTGMGWDQMGTVMMGDTLGEPTAFSQDSDVRYVKVNQKVRDLQFRVSSNSVESDYTLLGLMAEGNIIKGAPPNSWKLS